MQGHCPEADTAAVTWRAAASGSRDYDPLPATATRHWPQQTLPIQTVTVLDCFNINIIFELDLALMLEKEPSKYVDLRRCAWFASRRRHRPLVNESRRHALAWSSVGVSCWFLPSFVTSTQQQVGLLPFVSRRPLDENLGTAQSSFLAP